jgi:hypothetical protein
MFQLTTMVYEAQVMRVLLLMIVLSGSAMHMHASSEILNVSGTQ